MKKRTKEKLINSLADAHNQLNLVIKYIAQEDVEAAYRILTSNHNDLWRTRVTLFSKLHPEIKKTVVRP